MPYLKEYFLGRSSPQTISVNGAPDSSTALIVWDDAVMTGFRSSPRGNALVSNEISDHLADPYAYFLDRTSKTRYNERLAERGMTAQGGPDRGHTWELSKYTLHSSIENRRVRRVSKSVGIAEQTMDFYNPIWIPSSASSPILLRHRDPRGNDLEAFAKRAYVKVAPTATMFDAARFLGELREGLPSIIPNVLKGQSKILKNAGSDYLNIEFGWKPLIDDLIKMGNALLGATNTLSGSGERVHRSYGTPTTFDSEVITSNGVNSSLTNRSGYTGQIREFPELNTKFPGSSGNSSAPNGSYWITRTLERRQWFEGEFTNFFRLGFDPSSYIDRLSVLVNTKLTPATLWELAPWSWLIDWFLRIGDSITANEMAANDLLIMHYGYAMEHSIRRDLVSIKLLGNLTSKPSTSTYTYWQGLPDSANYVSTSEVKRRIRANPYGFTTGGTSGLSGSQLAILGALGLTKLK